MPTITHIDSFGHQTISTAGSGLYTATAGTPAIVTTPVHDSDPASLEIDTVLANEYVRYDVSGSPTIAWMGFWVRFPSVPSGGTAFATIRIPTAANHARIYFNNPSGSIVHVFCSLPFGGVSSAESGDLSLNTWYWVECTVSVGSSTWVQTVKINGETLTSTQTGQLSTTLNGSIYQLGNADSATMQANYSCFVAGSASSTVDWSGERYSRYFQPSAVGTHNLDAATSTSFYSNDPADPTAITSTETTSWNRLDATPLSTGSDFVGLKTGGATASHYVEHELQDSSQSNVVSAIRIVNRLRNKTASAAVATSKISDSGTEATVYSGAINSTTSIYKSLVSLLRPSTGTAWTNTSLSSLKHRFGYQGTPTGDLLLEGVGIDAVFNPAASDTIAAGQINVTIRA